jgi:arylsulfatase A-like enzyme
MKVNTFRLMIYLFLCAAVLGAEDDIELFGKKRARPDVILIAIDTLRTDHLGCYGYSRSTSPNIDAFAQEGTLLEQCYSPATWTLPALMSIFTGMLPSVHQIDRIEEVIPLSESIPTLAEAFREAGYFTGAILCNYYARGAYGFYRGFDLYDEYSVFMDTFTSGFDPAVYANRGITHVRSGRSVMESAKAVLQRAKGSGKPVFLFVLFYDPHDEYLAPYDIYYGRYGVGYDDSIIGCGLKDRRHVIPEGPELENLIKLYDSEIVYSDRYFRKLLEAIDMYCRREDTITILIGDHGEAFGERGALLHGNNLYREESQVPMIWRWPGVVAAGHRVQWPVSLLDIAGTLGELFQFEMQKMCQGQSLWPALLGRQTRQDRMVVTERGTAAAITQGRYRWHCDGNRRLVFDWMNDPLEQTNIIHSLETETRERFEESYRRYLKDSARLLAEFQARGLTDVKPIELSEDEKQRLRSLGYVQ